ncbi:MAG: TRAP transporter large permease [Alcaligenaceae bacterium]|nr:TRAP transporter large permease [Alcaligenaceae bacterium]
MIQVTTLALLGLLATGIPVAATLMLLAWGLSEVYSPFPLLSALGETAWTAMSNYLLFTIPLFVLMGEILLRSGIATKMYGALAQWINWLPGGLMHANITACTIFSATSGSSAATAATIGTVAIPQMDRYRYNRNLFLGTIAAGGTLGILIPPSINMIIYAAITNTSIPKLYLAGVVPGLILATVFMLIVVICCLLVPQWRGAKAPTSWRLRLTGLVDLLPPIVIFLAVLGSIYAGLATPTESAALGVLASLALAALQGRVSVQMLQSAFEGTLRITAMLMLIITTAFFLNFVMVAVGLVAAVNQFIMSLGLNPLEVMLIIIGFYVILGCFMESLSMMITTLPIVAPIVTQLGYDPVWFGVVLMILVEVALITPPVGINLFIVQAVRRKGSINDIILGSAPFVVGMFTMIGLLIAWPQIALWLPALY